jgi:hypothetical protein
LALVGLVVQMIHLEQAVLIQYSAQSHQLVVEEEALLVV